MRNGLSVLSRSRACSLGQACWGKRAWSFAGQCLPRDSMPRYFQNATCSWASHSTLLWYCCALSRSTNRTPYSPLNDNGLAMSLTRATSPSFCQVKRPRKVTTRPSSFQFREHKRMSGRLHRPTKSCSYIHTCMRALLVEV